MDDHLISPQVVTAEQAEEIQRAFVVKVYSWMLAGLMVTGIVALFTIQVPTLLEFIFGSRFIFFGMMIAQVALVVWLSARVEKLSATAATVAFLVYAALTGLTLSVLLIVYTGVSIASTLFVTAGVFGAMSAYGYVTKRDLTGFGSFLLMGLVGLILATVVNLFLNSSTASWIITYMGIFIFVGLAAYDTQRIKAMSSVSLQGAEVEQKGAVIGALRLYLDFINLFLMLLRATGSRR